MLNNYNFLHHILSNLFFALIFTICFNSTLGNIGIYFWMLSAPRNRARGSTRCSTTMASGTPASHKATRQPATIRTWSWSERSPPWSSSGTTTRTSRGPAISLATQIITSSKKALDRCGRSVLCAGLGTNKYLLQTCLFTTALYLRNLTGHTDYHLFKEGIRPMWEVSAVCRIDVALTNICCEPFVYFCLTFKEWIVFVWFI